MNRSPSQQSFEMLNDDVASKGQAPELVEADFTIQNTIDYYEYDRKIRIEKGTTARRALELVRCGRKLKENSRVYMVDWDRGREVTMDDPLEGGKYAVRIYKKDDDLNAEELSDRNQHHYFYAAWILLFSLLIAVAVILTSASNYDMRNDENMALKLKVETQRKEINEQERLTMKLENKYLEELNSCEKQMAMKMLQLSTENKKLMEKINGQEAKAIKKEDEICSELCRYLREVCDFVSHIYAFVHNLLVSTLGEDGARFVLYYVFLTSYFYLFFSMCSIFNHRSPLRHCPFYYANLIAAVELLPFFGYRLIYNITVCLHK
ncbi:hypothetical protein M3Y94_00682400 [Aphelenchoides besseyi]|nr:hypothetical protein M3Y94_00682400 [Aphelenchoides besseyi]KAI6231443.1 hypothetical protein M3Y95_00382300 [Aphelenchoides besseyi]